MGTNPFDNQHLSCNPNGIEGKKEQKKFGPFLDLCVSSLRRGHANLLCIVPILSDVPEGTITFVTPSLYKHRFFFLHKRCGTVSLHLQHINGLIFE
ncbi:hypothetical protein YC2023_112985 [Brassica napus]